MTDETAFASLQDKPDAEHENDKNAAPNNFNSLEGSNKMTEETAFASLQDEKDTEHENDKNAAPNDFATLEGPSSLESSEVNMCTDTSQISEHVRIGFVDEKSANDYFEVGRIRNCLRNRIFLILLAAVLVVAVTVFVAVFFNITGKNDLQESPEVTTTSLLPKKLSCSPVIQSAKTGEDVSYACNLQNVHRIIAIHVAGSQFSYESTLGGSQGGTFTGDSVTVMVDLGAENQIIMTLTSVTCDMEGGVTVTVNGNIADTVNLQIISDPQKPQLSIPENIFKNQETAFNCSGNVGRKEDGSPVVALGFEILPEGQNASISITGQSVTALTNTSDNCENHIIIQYRILAIYMMNGAVLSCVSTAISDQSRLFKVSSTPIELLEANIFFDKDLEYKLATGDTFSLTCSFQNLQNVNQLKITRGENKDVVMVLQRDGTVDQPLNHIVLSPTSAAWGDDYGSVSITANITCGDENLYICEADSNSGKAVVLITVLSRPEAPTLKLSYELVEGQGAWSDRLSECKAQIGDPAGSLVVEILNGGEFQELAVIYGKGYPQNRSLDCGIEQTIQFYFSDLVDLNNTEARCAVKPAEIFNVTKELLSETQIIRTVDGSYCFGVNSSFYVHPYDCHYFVDCNDNGSSELHFTKCDKPDSCPNPLGGCDVDSCASVCTKGPKPYLHCNGTLEAELDDTVTIICELGNVGTTALEAISVFQDDAVILNETWANGTASTLDGSLTLTYTADEIVVNIARIQCHHGAVYTISVNNMLSDNATVVIKTNAEAPIISSTRFVAGQMATLTCDGVVGNPQESRQLFIEAWIKAGSYMTYTFGSMPPASEVTTFNSTSCSYQKMVVMTIESMEMMNGSIEFRCRTATDAGNLTSEIVNVFVDPQEVDFQPQESKVAVGVALSIECNVTGVTDLTSIRIFRGTDSSQTVCDVTQDTLSNRVTGIFCSGEVIPSGGRLMMNFTSVQCSDEDTYVCECNPEASTQKRASLSISRPTQNPVFTSVPLTLVENIPLLEAEKFTCEADLGYPSSNLLILHSNKDGTYETYDDEFGVGRTFLNENCSVFETVTINHYTFDSSWNNTQLRCAIAYDNGTVTAYISDEITIQLIPEIFCEGQEDFHLHPYDQHLYIKCSDIGLVVNTCNNRCSSLTNGNLTCEACSSP